MSTKGFGTPGLDCPIPAEYGALRSFSLSEEEEYGALRSRSLSEEEAYGALSSESLLAEEAYGAMAAHAAGELGDDEYGVILAGLRSSIKQKKIDRIIGKLEELLRQEKMDKARKKAEKLAKAVAKMEILDPDYSPDEKVQAWLAFADGSIDDPRDYGAAATAGTGGLFDTARAIQSGTVVAPSLTYAPVRRRSYYHTPPPPRPRPSRPTRRRPGTPRMAKTHGPRPGMKARALDRYGQAYIGAASFSSVGNTDYPIDRVDLIEESYGGVIDRADLFDDSYGGLFSRDKTIARKTAQYERQVRTATTERDKRRARRLWDEISELEGMETWADEAPTTEVWLATSGEFEDDPTGALVDLEDDLELLD